MSTTLFSNTPSVTVLDNRGLVVRDIAYHRPPDVPEVTNERITHHQYDARGALTKSADPRLHAVGLANVTPLTDLTGTVLRTVSADAGTTLALSDAAGRPLIAVRNVRTAHDGTEDRTQAVTHTWQYEDATLPGRPLSVTEQVTGEAARITERFVYAGNTDAEKVLNLAGQCVSLYDTAGLVQTDSLALTGVPLSVSRRLLKDADSPDVVTDWQGNDSAAWNALLDGETFTILSTVDASGAVLTTTDAKGNAQRVVYDVAGLLSGSWLTLKGGTEQVIVKSQTYSAAGQKLCEEHGNGVVTTYTYEAQTQRLTGIKTERPAGHASGAKVLQDLRYDYDPVGNVLKVSNDAEETRFWRNQKVVPENTYVYDSLYQLVSATGREMAGAGSQSTGLPSAAVPLPTDSAAYTNYTRTYSYDVAGNLMQIRHSAPATNNTYTTNITISDRSNRGVLSTLTENPADVDTLFTAGGQQMRLQPGQTLNWTSRNELLTVTPVMRDGGTDDRESYRYDAGSQRMLKVSAQKTANSTQTQRVVYLPGLELRTTKAGDTETGRLQVITVGEAGRAQVRVLHWEKGKPDSIDNNQLRYSYDNLIGSSGLELDGDGNIISLEEYYPYGGTAVLTARNAVEADYKTDRYSGKERDATGLYYYGYRYYQPWAGRWLSADPAGTIDGLNLFRMVRNNPVTMNDSEGLAPVYAPRRVSDTIDDLSTQLSNTLFSVKRTNDKGSEQTKWKLNDTEENSVPINTRVNEYEYTTWGRDRGNLRTFADEKMVFYFDDIYKNKKRLNIVGHGSVDGKGNGQMGVILEGKKDNLSGKDLKYVFDFRHGKGSLEKYNYIRLISCCSAEGINPLGQQVADEFGLETKAYKGLVLSLPPEVLDANKLNSEFIGTRPDGKTIDYNKILINAKQTYVVKLPPTTPEKLAKWTGYSPVKFKPKNLSQKV
ncbi:putative deoxyribonuclease RhsC [compost metagenome]